MTTTLPSTSWVLLRHSIQRTAKYPDRIHAVSKPEAIRTPPSFACALQALGNGIKAITDMRRQYAFKIQEVEEEVNIQSRKPRSSEDEHSGGTVLKFDIEDPIVLSAHATIELASEALVEHKRFITHNDNGDFLTRDYALYMYREVIDGVDIILTPRSHITPIEVRLRMQKVDVKEDENENEKKKLADAVKEAETDEVVRIVLERNRAEFGRRPMELRQVRATWRAPWIEGQEGYGADSDDSFYSDLETELGREVPRRFRGHSIDGSVRTVKWKTCT
ncbi:hypothetical protein BKA63DRAFT_603002 [Paraphoma chrysanthemicola]|nr:hypothetical protein BKA63DRAFT_603002 [Paraphoma chrysanthemicola]